MDKAISKAMKHKKELDAKDLKASKVKPEKLTHAQVQALIDSANAKKNIDKSERKMMEMLSQIEKKITELQGDVKGLKEKQKEKQK